MGEQAHHLQLPQRGEQCIYWHLRRSDGVGSSLLLGGGIFLSLGSFGALRPPLDHRDLSQNRRIEVVYNFTIRCGTVAGGNAGLAGNLALT
jgi:hypothetical protein